MSDFKDRTCNGVMREAAEVALDLAALRLKCARNEAVLVSMSVKDPSSLPKEEDNNSNFQKNPAR